MKIRCKDCNHTMEKIGEEKGYNIYQCEWCLEKTQEKNFKTKPYKALGLIILALAIVLYGVIFVNAAQVTESHGVPLNVNVGNPYTIEQGFTYKPNTNMTIYSITKVSTATPTTAYIYRTSGTVHLGNATFVGNIAILSVPINLTQGVQYNFVADSNGANFDQSSSAILSYPINLTYGNITQGWDGGGTTRLGLLESFNLTIIPSPLAVIQNSPVDWFNSTGLVTFNCSRADAENMSLYIDGSLNTTNIAGGGCWIPEGCSDFNNTLVYTTSLIVGNHYWSCSGANKSTFPIVSSSSNRNLTIKSIIENSVSYNSTSYEDSTESFTLNISSVSTPTARLYYNGTAYTSTITPSGSQYLVSNRLTLSSVGNKSIFWSVDAGGVNINTTVNYQNVLPIQFGLCNSSLTVPYVNYTFKDETTGLAMNASIDLLTFNYGLISTTQKQYLFTNTSVNNPIYAFCFNPSSRTIQAETNWLQYSFTGYPQRHYYSSGTLNNITTNTTLYLLSSSTGIYSTIQVVNNAGTPLSGVTVSVEREFSGIWTLVEQGVTDTAGLATFWVNPNYDHRYTLTKAGYVTSVITLRPTQSIYTITMSQGTSNLTYINSVNGVRYTRTPLSGIVKPGSNTFTYNISSTIGDMVNCMFELVYYNGTVISSISSSCTTNAYLTLTYIIKNGDSIKGRYYVDMGSGYILLEDDGNWRSLESGSSAGMFVSFMEQLNDRSGWGINDTIEECHREIYNGDLDCQNYLTQVTCEADALEYGNCVWEQTADNMKFEFTMIVGLFLFIAIFAAGINIVFNYDLYSPGYFLILLPILLWIISFAGQFNQPLWSPHSILYIQGATFADFFDNYIIAIYATLISLGVYLRSQRSGA